MDVSLGDLYLDLRILGNPNDKCIQIIMDAVTMGMWVSWDGDKITAYKLALKDKIEEEIRENE